MMIPCTSVPPNHATGADGVNTADFRKGPACLEFYRAAAHLKRTAPNIKPKINVIIEGVFDEVEI